jgi:hypothetical protein
VARLSYQSSRAMPAIAAKACRWQRTKVSKLWLAPCGHRCDGKHSPSPS